ncbi:MAG: hypothetical protein GY917_13015, partial [Planctomycetaceae bacterium]|nr:hypothetical protein [Planctomycetaceae bacterium]
MALEQCDDRRRRLPRMLQQTGLLLAVALLLSGCGRQKSASTVSLDAVIATHDQMFTAERAYIGELQLSLNRQDLDACRDATAAFLAEVQDIELDGCPDDYIQAMRQLENPIGEIETYLASIEDFQEFKANINQFNSLQQARLDTTHYLNHVVENLGLLI